MSNNIRACKFCDPPQDIYTNADVYGKWHPTNLDGSPHKHVKGLPQASQGQAMRKGYPNTAPPHTDIVSVVGSDELDDESHEDKMRIVHESKPDQQFWNQRDADIKLAHKENIQATTALTDAIHVLAEAISKLADKQQKYQEIDGYELITRRDNPENEP